MTYDQAGKEFNYVFNGHGLVAGEDYTLIYYPDPWPGYYLKCLDSGTSNNGGNIQINGSVETGDLPAAYDWNNPSNPFHGGGTTIDGAKIWLVKSGDVSCDSTPSQMIGWNPTKYLFEEKGITFDGPDSTILLTVGLWKKNPVGWSLISNDGTLTYLSAWSAFKFLFDAKNLTPSTGYSLIYYADPWPGNHPGALIASGIADSTGNLRLVGSTITGNLPNPADANIGTGAKIWLVSSSDYNPVTRSMIGWNPANYLFDGSLISYTQTP